MPIAPALSLGLLALSFAGRAAPSPTPLPLRKIRLYETGVGYFERHGTVHPDKSLALPLPAAHLDDALKSLVVLEATGGVRVEGVAFPTAVSEGLARAMAGLPDETDAAVSYADLLRGLVGAAVEVTTEGKRVRGRLVDIEGPYTPRSSEKAETAEPATEDASATEQYYLLLVLGDDDALRRISTRDVEGVRAVEGTAAARLDVATEALTDHSARRVQTLRVSASARGQLGLGYIAESPVWRTTYRVVLPTAKAKGDATGDLQAWALVHNDTDEDWRGVRMELVNGRPTSFLHPLAAPRYARRELVAPTDELSTVPQLAKTTVDRMWLDRDVYGDLVGEEIGDSYGAGGFGLVGTGRGGGGTGEGTIGLGNFGTLGGELDDLAELAKAESVESGALFIYRPTDAIDLDAHHSALVPIVQDEIEVESMTWFAKDGNDGISGVRLVNTTSQTLPPGAVSFFADGGFVGEAVLDRLRPKERRFVGYGGELDVELERGGEALGETTIGVTYSEGVLERQFIAKRKIVLEIHNRGRRAQRVYAALDVSRFAKLESDGTIELDFDLATDTPLATTRVDPGASVSHTLVASTAGRERAKPDAAMLARLADDEGVPQADRIRVERALAHARHAEKIQRSIAARERAIVVAGEDLERLRADLTALGAAGARSRTREKLARKLAATEAEIAAAREAAAVERTEAAKVRARMRAELDALD